MTVKELIEKLQAVEDKNLRVIIDGYEGGKCDVVGVSNPKEIALNVRKEWYYGQHEEKHWDDDFPEAVKEFAIEIE